MGIIWRGLRMGSEDEKFITKLRKEIICEVRNKIREERYKENSKPSFYTNWAEHQKGQIRGILGNMRQANNGLKIIDVGLLRDLEYCYQNSISRHIYYDSIFSTIENIKKFHELKLADDTYENRRKAYDNALTIVNEGRDDELFPQFPSTRISTYRTLDSILRAYHLDKEKRTQIISSIKFSFDKKSNGEKYKNREKIREISSKKTKFEKEQYEKFNKIFKVKIIDRNE